MQAPQSYSSRLRELGLVSPSESIAYADVGEWRQHGQFFVARMVVGVSNGNGQKERAYWLKCPHDFFGDIDQVVRDRIALAKKLRGVGCNIPATEWLEPGTMIQQEVKGEVVQTDRGKIPVYAQAGVRREMDLYASAGYKYMDGVGGNFIIDDQGRAWCIDLDFNKIPNEERAAHAV